MKPESCNAAALATLSASQFLFPSAFQFLFLLHFLDSASHNSRTCISKDRTSRGWTWVCEGGEGGGWGKGQFAKLLTAYAV